MGVGSGRDGVGGRGGRGEAPAKISNGPASN